MRVRRTTRGGNESSYVHLFNKIRQKLSGRPLSLADVGGFKGKRGGRGEEKHSIPTKGLPLNTTWAESIQRKRHGGRTEFVKSSRGTRRGGGLGVSYKKKKGD